MKQLLLTDNTKVNLETSVVTLQDGAVATAIMHPALTRLLISDRIDGKKDGLCLYLCMPTYHGENLNEIFFSTHRIMKGSQLLLKNSPIPKLLKSFVVVLLCF